ncbi:MAG TPA: alpha/beta fold hydrolase [Phycisphaerales bacterium]|nr:alpha/beta fold hydrolase [Phycisphaerales bacterium]
MTRPRRRRLALAGCVLAVGAAIWAAGHRSDRAQPEDSSEFVRALDDLDARLDALLGGPAPRLTPEPGLYLVGDGGALERLTATSAVPPAVVVLVHGLDDPGDIWEDLLPALRDAGLRAAVFEYPNDQGVAPSADLLRESLGLLGSAGAGRVDLVCHSMGGLVALDCLTRAPEHESPPPPEVRRLITVGTPMGGSPWARVRALAEVREHALRWLEGPGWDPRSLLGSLRDGLGEAGADLMPGSAFLDSLHARALPDAVRLTVIAGRLTAEERTDTSWLASSWLARRLLGAAEAERLADEARRAVESLGDGVVPLDSALRLDAPDTVLLEASHRGLVRLLSGEQRVRAALEGAAQPEPPAIPIILDRLRD